MGQGFDEAKRLEQKVIELYGQGRYEEAIDYELIIIIEDIDF